MRESEVPYYSGGGGSGGGRGRGGGNVKYESGRYHLTTASNHSSGNRPWRKAGRVFQDSQGSARVALCVLAEIAPAIISQTIADGGGGEEGRGIGQCDAGAVVRAAVVNCGAWEWKLNPLAPS